MALQTLKHFILFLAILFFYFCIIINFLRTSRSLAETSDYGKGRIFPHFFPQDLHS